MTSKILLDTGPSTRGFHRLEAHFRCPRLYALGYGQAGAGGALARKSREQFPPAAPLVRGSIGHAGLAHLYIRQLHAQNGGNPDRYYKPTEAMALVADSFGDLGLEMLPVATKVVLPIRIG